MHEPVNLSEQELADLTNCKTQKEWESVCDRIKKFRHGMYPDDFFAKVHLSGLMAKALMLPIE